MPRTRKEKKQPETQEVAQETAPVTIPESPVPAEAEPVANPSPVPAGEQAVAKEATAVVENNDAVDVTVSNEFVVSAAERQFIEQMRIDDRNAKERLDRQENVDRKKEAPSAEEIAYAGIFTQPSEEEAYAEIFSPTSTLNDVHAHCLGVVRLRPLELRDAVTKAVSDVGTWTHEQKDSVCSAIRQALPILAKELIKMEGLPVPASFSRDRVIQAYKQILERHLAFTRVLTERKSNRRGERGSSDESSDEERTGEKSASKSAKREEKKALQAVTKEVEESMRIGKDSYSSDHLYECERLLIEYKSWQNPGDGAEQKATCPKSVRDFMKRHLAVPQAPISSAYDQAHVKADKDEQKHVTFLLNRMGFLASRIAKERLSRAGKELNRHGRIRKGAELSQKERKESIEGEKMWAGEVRWLSILLSKGRQAYRKYENGKKSQASQAHLASAGVLPESFCKSVAASVALCEPGSSSKRSRSRSRSRSNSRRRYRGQRYRGGRSRYGRYGDRDRDRNRERNERERKERERKAREARDKYKCWHCNETGHVIMDCPVAKAGKPPAPGSRFAKSRAKETKNKE